MTTIFSPRPFPPVAARTPRFCRPRPAPRRPRAFLAACVIPATIVACGPRDGPERLEQALRWETDPIHLQENADVINVTPEVSLDRDGAFLVADEREGQVRRYDREGRLLWHVGRKGSGPGEFRTLSRVLRLPSGRVLATEWSNAVAVYDSTGARLERTLRSPFSHVEDMDVVDDTTVIVSALLRGSVMGPRLHVWNPERNTVRASFFAPLPGAPNRTAAVVAGWTKAAVRGDTVAAVFSLSDTVYFFSLRGHPMGALPIPYSGFRRVDAGGPVPTGDPVRRARWLASFDLVSDVHWLPDGRLLLPYQSFSAERALARTWHLFAMDRRGRRIFEERDAPRLLAVDSVSGKLYFVARGAEAPNQWAAAYLR